MATEYSPEEQAAISRQYPEIVWRDGQPFTRETRPNLPSDTDDPNQFADAGMTESLVSADPSEGGVPWWMWASLVGGPAAAEGIGAGLGALGVGGGGAGAAGSTAVPAGVGALPVGAVPTASIIGPAGAGGLTAAGAGIEAGVIAPSVGGTAAGTAATTGGALTGAGEAAGGLGGTAATNTAANVARGEAGWLDRLKRYGGYARNIAGAFGGAAEASANAAESEALINANQYNTAQDAQMNLGRLDLDRNIEDRAARNKAARIALATELFGGDETPTAPIISARGVRPQSVSTGGGLSEAARARASEIGAREMDRYRAGGGNTYQGGQILPTPRVNVSGNSALNKGAFVSSLLGGWGSEDELEK